MFEPDICICNESGPRGIAATFPIRRLYPKIPIIQSSRQHYPPWKSLENKQIMLIGTPYPVHIMKNLLEKAQYVLVLDTRLITIDEASKWSARNFYIVLGETKTLPEVCWEYYHGEEPLPWFIRYICDIDTWILPNSKLINDIMSYMGWHTWMKFEEWYSSPIPEYIQIQTLLTQSGPIMELRDKSVKNAAEYAILCKFMEYKVLLATTQSNILALTGDYIIANYDCDFVALWRYFPADDCWKVSMKTARDDINLAGIAISLGGGGNEKSAGFTIYGENSRRIDSSKSPRGTIRDHFALC